MRAVITRVKNARVEIGGEVAGQIGAGFLVLLGVRRDDTEKEADKLADKLCGLRVFEDENGCRSRRPGFSLAARPETAIPLYERVIAFCRGRGFTVATGQFGAEMQVFSQNDGPVTIILDTEEL